MWKGQMDNPRELQNQGSNGYFWKHPSESVNLYTLGTIHRCNRGQWKVGFQMKHVQRTCFICVLACLDQATSLPLQSKGLLLLVHRCYTRSLSPHVETNQDSHFPPTNLNRANSNFNQVSPIWSTSLFPIPLIYQNAIAAKDLTKPQAKLSQCL